ncbi:MAG: 16S rRNA (guanine(527)-N(7))-methyltransferase RsmG [Oscillospiraceae bacterium]
MEKLEDILREGLKLMGQEVTEDALRRFRIYYERLTEVGSVMNLTAIKGEGPVATLHFLDSAALLQYADFSGARVLDVGTGAGFPGLPLAILKSDARFTLLDSQQKRIDFLQDTVSRLGLKNVECVCLRAEEAPPEYRESFDIVTSRAVARLNVLAELCLPFVKLGGSFIAMKALDCEEERQEAQNAAHELGGSFPDLRRTYPSTPGAR